MSLPQPQVDSTQRLTIVFRSVIFCRLQRCHTMLSVRVSSLELDPNFRFRLVVTTVDCL
jgi:hypothetical protein